MPVILGSALLIISNNFLSGESSNKYPGDKLSIGDRVASYVIDPKGEIGDEKIFFSEPFTLVEKIFEYGVFADYI